MSGESVTNGGLSRVNESIRVAHLELARFAARVLEAKGMRSQDAAAVADVLVWADLRGVASHGVARLPQYVGFIERRELDPAASPRVRMNKGASFVLDAAYAAGPVAMIRAIEETLARAGQFTVGLGLVSRTAHTGAIGYYADQIARRGCAGIVLGAGPPSMAYHGARVSSLSTSPIAIAVPGSSEPVVLDMATSVAAMGRIASARRAGTPIPAGWALAKDGSPTTDAAAAVIPLPVGGAKGSGLSFMFECLTGVLAGTPILSAMVGSGQRRHMQNAMLIAVDIAAFRPLDDYRRDIDALGTMTKGLPRQTGFDEILLPGERGGREARAQRTSGIVIARKTWRDLVELAGQLNVDLPPVRDPQVAQ